MALAINDATPDFEAQTTEGRIRFHGWIGNNWAVLFSHPKDFTPVCTTELGHMAKIKPEFDKRGVKIIGLSVDPVGKHSDWANDIKETQGFAPNYPIIADGDYNVSKLYGMLPTAVSGDPAKRSPADKPYRGKPAVRNDREGRGNVGIIRSPNRASTLPDPRMLHRSLPVGRRRRHRLKGVNEDEFPALLQWAHGRSMDLTLIEVMPLGDVGEQRLDQYLPLSIVRARLAERFTLTDIDYRTGGPARYVHIAETCGRLGLITPLTHNFCESCNRVRVTCTGTLYMCLGQEDAADLRTPLRASEGNELLDAAISEAITRKPKGHDFVIDRRHQRPAVSRHMSVTGG